jgi:hypothetical protein
MKNILGAYGSWASQLLEKKIPSHSLRSEKFKNLTAWRTSARERVWDRLAAPPRPKTPIVKVLERGTFDGLDFERLSWQLPWGPRTEAVLLKPQGLKSGEKLPAILALHDHSAIKYFGWKKIAQISDTAHPMIEENRSLAYGGLAWANEAARRGHVVLCHDAFLFGSRRIRVSDTLDEIQNEGVDPTPEERISDIKSYNVWASDHEHLVAKSLFCAGTTWPGVFVREDQTALSILADRKEVDSKRLSCGGLSGGGLRTVFLAGLDERIKVCFCAGFMTTWQDLLLSKAWTHTWMTYVPLLPKDLEFGEILGLRVPLPTFVLNCKSDSLFTTSEVKRSAEILKDIYLKAKAPESFRFSLYSGGHQLNAPMQEAGWKWLKIWL